jgi:hypothetical protein
MTVWLLISMIGGNLGVVTYPDEKTCHHAAVELIAAWVLAGHRNPDEPDFALCHETKLDAPRVSIEGKFQWIGATFF